MLAHLAHLAHSHSIKCPQKIKNQNDANIVDPDMPLSIEQIFVIRVIVYGQNQKNGTHITVLGCQHIVRE